MSAKWMCKRTLGLRKASFTLVELLVVIAIISILASMLLPALSAAKTKVRAVSCMNSMRTIGQYFSMYNDSYDDYWPNGGEVNFTGTIIRWRERLISAGIISDTSEVGEVARVKSGAWVLKENKIMNCCPDVLNKPALRIRCYSYNLGPGVGGYFYSSSNYAFVKGSQVKHPTGNVCLFESSPEVAGQISMNKWQGLDWFTFKNHLNTSNYLFVDGHVERNQYTFMGFPDGTGWSLFTKRVDISGNPY
jgi:prepilin-type processing-associated H-X9-DG protein/prepilin-type N-terminal cleavage/methylation domain-containing protein